MLNEEVDFLFAEVDIVSWIPSNFLAYDNQLNHLDGNVFVEETKWASLIEVPNQSKDINCLI